MRPFLALRRKIHLLLAGAVLILLWYRFWRLENEDKKIPVLRKLFVQANDAVIYGPFSSKTYSETPKHHSLTLVTHSSLKNLYYLQTTSSVWNSPISVAIWAHGDLTRLLELIYILTISCAHKHALHVSILVPTSMPHNVDISKIDWDQVLSPSPQTCSERTIHNRLYALRALEPESNYSNKKVSYPNNQLRNIALTGVQTSHALVLDIDILPSVDLDKLFITYSHVNEMVAESTNSAFILPVFESEKMQTNRWKIDRLQKELKDGTVRQFYGKLCPQCQGATQYTNWIERQSKNLDSPMDGYAVPYVPGWEPFIIMRTDSHPKYDERFKQFGYNRMSLICELYLAGKTFYVLDKVFLIHDGFKEEENFHKDKEKELSSNAELYQQFMTELAKKYGTDHHC